MQKHHWFRSAYLTAALASACWFSITVASAAQSSATGAQSPTPAQPLVSVVAGSEVFRLYCAVCHGTSGRGDGPLADSMRRRPANLTEIMKRNGGAFPADQIYRTIDGRQPVRGHGGPDMPVWGDAFQRSAEGLDEAGVRARIESLVRYLESIQARQTQ